MKRTFALIAVLLTVACAGTPKVTPAGFCDLAKPIYWSEADTAESIRQAKAHNAVGVDKCGWGK